MLNNREHIAQGSLNLSLEVQSAAEFSSNPDQTHLPVIISQLWLFTTLSLFTNARM